MNEVEPTVVKTKHVQGTPFATNKPKEERTRPPYPKTDGVGAPPYRPPYKPPQGQPMLTSTQVNNPSTMRPTFKLEMFEPAEPKMKQPIGTYPQYEPVLDMFGDKQKNKQFDRGAFNNLFAPTSAVSYGPNLRIPMQQVYNITLPGPTGGHVEMNQVYENLLPGKEMKMTSTTVGERLQTYDYVRQIMVKMSDGEEVSIDDRGPNSLLSQIKLLDLNPNYYSPMYNNPYKGLPYGLLIYRTCFPIRFDEKSQSTICAKNSMGLNMRLYSLSYAEYYSWLFRQKIYLEYDVWREIAYYEYVRDCIVKKKQSPNFVIIYAYFQCPNRAIDFFSLKTKCLTQKELLTQDYQNFVQTHKLMSKNLSSSELIRPMTLGSMTPGRAIRGTITKLPDEISPELQAYSGTTLIAITEAPYHNLYQWASRSYDKWGIVNRMITSGYHDNNVWNTMLFQIVHGMFVLQEHGIYIKDMTIEDNIYVTDLKSTGKAMGYWKYIVKGISYYVPNYGFLAMIDTNFKDIQVTSKALPQCKREYKIYTSDIFGKKYPLRDIQTKVWENYKRIINTNAFSKEHTQNNVMKPPEDILKLIESMTVDSEVNIEKVMSKYFRNLMNNRIGTLLRKDTEVPNIRSSNNFKKGDMAVQIVEEDLFKWVMVQSIKPNGIVEVITRETPDSSDFIDQDVRIETLRQYSQSEKIEQNSNADVNFSESELLETYIIM